MKTFTGLLPLAVLLLAVAALVAWLFSRGSAFGPWLVAAVLFAHGWVHLVFLFPAGRESASSTDNPFDMDSSWLVDRGVDTGQLRSVGTVLAVATFLALAGAALAVLGWLVPGSWWAGLAVGGVLGSTVLLVLFFAPTLVLGFVINAGLLALVLQNAWEVRR